MNFECCCKQFQENIFHSTNNVVRTAGYSNKKKEREGAGGDKAIKLRNKSRLGSQSQRRDTNNSRSQRRAAPTRPHSD